MTAVDVTGLGKRFRRGQHLEPYKTAREALVGAFKRDRERSAPDLFWAFRDIDFEIDEGEAVAIIGRNGAGKSTLLKVLSRIMWPTEGRAEVRGRVGTLLEVGTGFHPELTGRQNITLNGSILGMTRRDIAARFDEIVEFAEVTKFIDTPVKRYSSGMQVRLAFSVAAHMEPDILIVDEVLAVGDASFQKKCLGKLGDVGGEGRTVIFVSHNMAAASQLCQRAILLEGGSVEMDGAVDDVVDHYLQHVASTDAELQWEDDPGRRASILRMTTRSEDGTSSAGFTNAEDVTLEVEFSVHERLVGDHLWFLLYRADGLHLATSADDDAGSHVAEEREPGRYVRRFRFPGGILNEGGYQFRVAIGKRGGVKHDDRYGGFFEIEDVTDYRHTHFSKRAGVLLIPVASHEERVDERVGS
ncbi:MAG TPA: ABC transporter ATP-binding protein [Solirubrobacteraceae bacterium]|nr:ABC transporter ATP-binding protein [Solirubrobacteraceae bacterium]